MQSMLNQGTTLLYVSHSIESVRNLCTKALWIDKGNVKMSGDVMEVSQRYMESF